MILMIRNHKSSYNQIWLFDNEINPAKNSINFQSFLVEKMWTKTHHSIFILYNFMDYITVIKGKFLVHNFHVIGCHFALIHPINTSQCSQFTVLSVYDITIRNHDSIGIEDCHGILKAPSNWISFSSHIKIFFNLFATFVQIHQVCKEKHVFWWIIGQGSMSF